MIFRYFSNLVSQSRYEYKMLFLIWFYDVIDVSNFTYTKMKRVKHLLWKNSQWQCSDTTVLFQNRKKNLCQNGPKIQFFLKTCIKLGNSFIHILWKYKGLMPGDHFCQKSKTNPTLEKAFFVKKNKKKSSF